LFAAGITVFLVVRRALVPPDFGLYGFYRAGALTDVAAKPLVYAGQGACRDCHEEVFTARQAGRHAKVACEACHGPLARHASGEDAAKPRELSPRALCLTCHVKSEGKPDAMPQIVPADHAPEGACTACHAPHDPKIG
jgi:hypothetical protein